MMRVLAWVMDAVIILMIVRAVIGMLKRRRTASPRADASPFGGKTQERIGGTLVRDPQCGTYIPEAGAIRVKEGGQTLYFCSPECRDAFQVRA
jgi:YHS domain-containing protein